MADAARAAILPHFRSKGLEADTKSDLLFDPVTVADREAEAAMRAVLAERRPQDAILGEEMGLTTGTSGITWVLDPIDGTRAFLCGTPSWGILIAAGGPEGPEFGLIDQPYIGERFEGGFGIARMTGPLGERALATRPARPLEQALLMTTFPEVGTAEDETAFRRVAAQVRLVRYGMDCYAYALLAAGHIDLVIEAGLHPYDIQGPMAVILAAGGVVTDWTGGPAAQGGRILAAANPQVHAAAMALLNA
ncbi:inositol monophosphatase family protein [Falsirhodobacter halotolerans]|nr:inositol monophosphatase family protein [Falsirhodobacter halotolerans]